MIDTDVPSLLPCDTVTSTNDIARNWIDINPRIRPTVVTANKQTKGKGRFGKTWWSPEGMGLYASFVTTMPQNPPHELTMLTSLIGNSIIRVLRNYTLLDIKQEGINDIYLDQRKLGGILCEVYKDYLIVGVGLNLFRPLKIRKDLVSTAIWLNEYCSEQLIDRSILINLITEVIFR